MCNDDADFLDNQILFVMRCSKTATIVEIYITNIFIVFYFSEIIGSLWDEDFIYNYI